MEKFGIFNLLSALYSPAAAQNEGAPEERQEAPAAPQKAENTPAAPGVFSAEERKTRAAEMLERHDRIARRIGRRH